MSESNAIVPTSQKTIIFYDDEITAVVVDGDEQEVYIPLRPLCDYLGVSWQGQNRRINEDEVLSDVIMSVNITLTDIDPSNRRPRTSKMLCLPLDYLNGWVRLFTRTLIAA